MQTQPISQAREHLAREGAFEFRPIPQSTSHVRAYRHAPSYPGMFGEQIIYQTHQGQWHTTDAWILTESMA